MPPAPAIVLFDGHCNLCAWSVRFVIERDPARRFRFAALHSPAGRELLAEHGLLEDAPDSIVLIEDGRVYTRSSAALRIARHLRGAWRLLGVFRIVPRVLRDPLYRVVARFRYRWFGRSEACLAPTPANRERFLENGVTH